VRRLGARLRCRHEVLLYRRHVNYLGDEGVEAVHATYGRNYARLSELKLKYDPGNFFRFNQNIFPQ
jgi:hypothetical protein